MPDIIFDSSGNNGADGIDGKDGNSIFTRKNAKSAKNGVDAKDIDFTLSSVKGSKIPGHIHIRGTIEGKNDFQRIDKEYFLGSDGKVILKLEEVTVVKVVKVVTDNITNPITV